MTPERLRRLGVFVAPSLWDEEGCARLRAAMGLGRLSPAEIYVNGYVVDPDMRRAFDVEIDPSTVAEVERAIDGIRGDVARFFGIELRATEGPSFLRYLPGGFYRAHHDCIEDRGEQWPRRVSVVLFLTTAGCGSAVSCEGGSLRLYGPINTACDPAPLDILPVGGTLVAFPSTVLHEVLPVTAGVRDTVVDWFY